MWRKSTYSYVNGDCVDVADSWRKSTHSIAEGECVETGNAGDGIAVRDSKHPDGQVLVFTGSAWSKFTANLAG